MLTRTRPHFTRPHHLAALAGAAALSCASHAASAQSNEYKLEPGKGWTQTAAPQPGTDEFVIAEARRALAEDRPGDAKASLDDWIKQHERTDNQYLPEAHLLRGDAKTARGDEFEALYDYEVVLKQFAASGSYVKAVERELDIAVRYVNGYHRKFLGMRIIGADDAGEELLIRVQERLPGSRLAERAGIELADFYFRTGQMELASEAYSLFLQNYPRSPYASKAMQRRVAATISRFKGPRYNGAPLLDATVLVKRFAALYPAQAAAAGMDEALLARMDESAGAEMLETANWYLSVRDPVSARYVLERLVARHPRTAAAGTALRTLVDRGWIDLEGEGARPAGAPGARSAADAPASAPETQAPPPLPDGGRR